VQCNIALQREHDIAMSERVKSAAVSLTDYSSGRLSTVSLLRSVMEVKNMCCIMWYDTVRSGVIWYDMVLCGMIRYDDTVWYDTV
jgi:hypothetical protein